MGSSAQRISNSARFLYVLEAVAVALECIWTRLNKRAPLEFVGAEIGLYADTRSWQFEGVTASLVGAGEHLVKLNRLGLGAVSVPMSNWVGAWERLSGRTYRRPDAPTLYVIHWNMEFRTCGGCWFTEFSIVSVNFTVSTSVSTLMLSFNFLHLTILSTFCFR